MTADGVNLVQAVTAVFVFADGSQPIPIGVDQITVHVNYNGDTLSANDIAILKLETAAPTHVLRYDIYRSSDEVGKRFDLVGYGRSGQGYQGQVLPSGTKRDGSNRYDALAEQLNGSVFFAQFVPAGLILAADFDNGLTANDAAGAWLGIHDTGLGIDEILTHERMELAVTDADAWDALVSDLASALDKQAAKRE